MVTDNDNSMQELQQRVDAEKAAKQAEDDAKRKEAEALNKPLTPKEYRFCQEWIKDCNGARSARDAGFGKSGARVQACRLLAKPNIAVRIADMQRRIAELAEIDATYVLTSIRETGERCLQHTEVTDHEGNGIGEFVFNAAGANKSFEMLGRHLELFTDKVKHGTDETLATLMAKLMGK